MKNNLEDEFLTEVETTIKTQKKKRKKGINSKRKGNSAENEVILSKGVRYHFVNARVETMTDHTGRKRDQLVLKVYMTQ